MSFSSLSGLRKTVLIVAKSMGTGLGFFWHMTIFEFLYLLADYNEIIDDENKRIKARRKK